MKEEKEIPTEKKLSESFVRGLKNLILDLEEHRDDYKAKYTVGSPDEFNNGYNKAKYEGYAFVVKKLEGLIKFHDVK